jgi:outer membrane protein TolC
MYWGTVMHSIYIMIFIIFLRTMAFAGSENAYNWTLDDVKKLADTQNPDLKAARANYDATSATILQAWSGYLPQVDVRAGFEQTTLPSPSAGATSQLGTALPYSSAVASVKQTLFDFGKTLAEIGASKALTKSAEQQGFCGEKRSRTCR